MTENTWNYIFRHGMSCANRFSKFVVAIVIVIVVRRGCKACRICRIARHLLEDGQGFDAKDGDRHDNDRDGDERNHTCAQWTFRILEQQPQFSLGVVVGQGFFRFLEDSSVYYINSSAYYVFQMYLDEALVFAEPIKCQFAQVEELDLLGEHVQRHVDWSPQPTAALVEVQDGVETRPVPVEKVLVPLGIVELSAPLGVAQ